MSRSEQLARALQTIVKGDPWYGPPLFSALHGATAVEAAARALPDTHSIWEIAAHLDAWNRVALRRLAGEEVAQPEADFPAPEQVTRTAWEELVRSLEESCGEVIAAAGAMTASRLGQPVPGKEYTAEFLLEGTGQHWIYHSGQIALLRKALR